MTVNDRMTNEVDSRCVRTAATVTDRRTVPSDASMPAPPPRVLGRHTSVGLQAAGKPGSGARTEPRAVTRGSGLRRTGRSAGHPRFEGVQVGVDRRDVA